MCFSFMKLLSSRNGEILHSNLFITEVKVFILPEVLESAIVQKSELENEAPDSWEVFDTQYICS